MNLERAEHWIVEHKHSKVKAKLLNGLNTQSTHNYRIFKYLPCPVFI